MKNLTKKELMDLEVEITPSGFTLWMGKKGDPKRRWMLDGSLVKTDAEIRLGNFNMDYPFKAVYSSATHSITLKKES